MAGNAWEFCVIKRPLLRFNNKSCHHFCSLTLFVDHRSITVLQIQDLQNDK